MAFIQGKDRYQSFIADFVCVDNFISEDNYTRVIDAFVDSLDLHALKFITSSGNNPGQKPYKTDVLLKIHLYCFYNGIPSSRKQERECSRNIELIWLTGNLKPDHSTIAAFCKDNSDALKNVFKQFSNICRKLNLFDFKVFSFDGSKFKASNSTKRAFTKDTLKAALLHIDEKINEYIDKIDDDTSDSDASNIAEFKEKLELVKKRKVLYSGIMDKMKKENLSEFCITDPDSKIMKNHGNIQPCYNIQSVVDSKHKLILDYDVSRQANDIGLLKPMSDKVREDYQLDKFIKDNPEHIITEIADTGYYKSSDLLDINNGNFKALVPKPSTPSSSGNAQFSKDNFIFDSEKDHYICPNKQLLTFFRNHTETRNGVTNHYRVYYCNSCLNCPFLDQCTTSVNGRTIRRNVQEDKLLQIDKEYHKDNSVYKLRKTLSEHPFRHYQIQSWFYPCVC